jgi:tripartite-type tricarboxylate transporter receptor subunit TctC
MRRTRWTAAAAMLAALSAPASAQEWPSRPVTMVVPYAAGGPVDTVGRIMARGLSEVLGQQVIVENIGGAGGMTGANRVAKATSDGYTFLLGGSATMTTVPALYGRKAQYNPLTDFEHVIQFADSARILIARKDLPASALKEFVAHAKANTKSLQYGSSGTGGGAHICALLLDQAMGLKITHVPYRGSGPAMQDLLAGRIDYICEQVSTAVQQIRAGTVKPIATMGLSRSDVLPDLPTAAEQGFEINCASLSAFEFPKGTPEAIITRLADATNKAVTLGYVQERFATLGVSVEPPERRTRAYYLNSLPPEVARQAEVMKARGLSAE